MKTRIRRIVEAILWGIVIGLLLVCGCMTGAIARMAADRASTGSRGAPELRATAPTLAASVAEPRPVTATVGLTWAEKLVGAPPGSESWSTSRANVWAAKQIGRTRTGAAFLREELAYIGWRESRGKLVGIHDLDRPSAGKIYRDAVRVRWLKPETCEHHRPEHELDHMQAVRIAARYMRLGYWSTRRALRWLAEDHRTEGHAVRGPHGIAYAYAARKLGDGCWPPEQLDHPAVSAYLAAGKIARRCRRWRTCRRADIREVWAGARKCSKRRAADGSCRASTRRQ